MSKTEKTGIPSTSDTPPPKRRNVLLKVISIGCLLALILFVLVGGGAFAGVYGYPRALNWIEEKGLSKFFGIRTTDDDKIVVPGGSREVISEESAIIDVVEDSKPAVVSIAVSSTAFNPDQGVVDNTSEIGTGFFVDSSGIIATNQHVVSNTELEYIVVNDKGEEFPVEKILRDDVNDIALLTIKKGNYPSLVLGDAKSLQVGQMVVAIGNPLGEFPGSVSVGIVSGLKRTVETSSGDFFFRGTIRKYENVIQTDAAINPGNSGGPLLDLDGNVIGVNFAKTGADNISFALPVNILKMRLEEYKKYGKFLRPYLGIRYQLISEEEAAFYRETVVPGAFIQYVEPGSPADKAGILKGDIITKIDGEDASYDFGALIQDKEIGQKIELTLWRAGKTIKVNAVLAERQE